MDWHDIERVLAGDASAGERAALDRWIGTDGAFIGMAGFGESAPAGDLYKHFGITADAVVEAARAAAAGLARAAE